MRMPHRLRKLTKNRMKKLLLLLLLVITTKVLCHFLSEFMINISLGLGLAVAFTGRLSLGTPQSLALFFPVQKCNNLAALLYLGTWGRGGIYR